MGVSSKDKALDIPAELTRISHGPSTSMAYIITIILSFYIAFF